ncbi:MAG: LamG domain-containing protein [Candidatus Paceibacterota bacterium]|jgi:hypothetical protein
MENKKKVNKLLHFALIALFLIASIGIVSATQYVTENGIGSPSGNFTNLTASFISSGNSSINDTGVFYNGELVSTRANTKTLCFASSGKGACDYICSNLTNCAATFQSAYAGSVNKTLYVRFAFYNTYKITPLSNLTVYFEDGTILNNTDPTYSIFNTMNLANGVTNYKQYGGKFYCNAPGCWYSNGNLTDITIQDGVFDTRNLGTGFPIFFDAFDRYLRVNFIHNEVTGTSGGWDMVGGGNFRQSKFNNNYIHDGNAQGFGVATVYYSEYKDNYFENVGNIIGFEGNTCRGNIIDGNIAYRSGDLKLANGAGDFSEYNIVTNNQLWFGGGINFGNSKGEKIENNLVYGSNNYGLYGTCDRCDINYNDLINTNTGNAAQSFNGSVATDGGIFLHNTTTYPAPTNTNLIGNRMYTTRAPVIYLNGTQKSAQAFTGGINIDRGVTNTKVIFNTVDNTYGTIADAGTTTTKFQNQGDGVNVLYGTSWAFIGNITANNICYSNGTGCASAVVSGNITVQNINKTGIFYPNFNGVSSDGLNIYFPFNNNFKSYSGKVISSTNVGSPSFINGKFGSAISFNTTNYVSFNQSQKILYNYSISFWSLRYSNQTATSELIYFSPAPSNSKIILRVDGLTGGTLRTYIDGNTGCWSSTAYTDLNWTHWVLAVSYTGTTATLNYYKNGLLLSSCTASGFTNITESSMGRISHDSGGFNGSIDQFMIWNRTLNANEVLSLYESNTEFNSIDAYQKINEDNNPLVNALYNLGSSVLRWLKLWVQDIDVSNNIVMSGNKSICMVSDCSYNISYNGSCMRSYGTGQTGNCF